MMRGWLAVPSALAKVAERCYQYLPQNRTLFFFGRGAFVVLELLKNERSPEFYVLSPYFSFLY